MRARGGGRGLGGGAHRSTPSQRFSRPPVFNATKKDDQWGFPDDKTLVLDGAYVWHSRYIAFYNRDYMPYPRRFAKLSHIPPWR
jgi:hypothetical protein